MTNNIAKIRAALEIADRKTDVFDEAKAALAELERAAQAPVGYVTPTIYRMLTSDDPIDRSAAGRYAILFAANDRSDTSTMPLYAAPPAPVAEIREPTPEECADMAEWFKSECQACCINPQESADYGRAIFDAVKIVMLPKSEG